MFKKRQLLFSHKLFLSLLAFSSIILIILQSYTWNVTENGLYQDLGKRAQIQAKEIAVIPDLIKYVEQKDIDNIVQLVSGIYQQSDANYIVVGDEHGNRLYHTANRPLGEPMVGGDNQEVLKGNSIVTIRKGSLGTSLRGKAPIFNAEHRIIGIISVGYMINDIYHIQIQQFFPFIIFCIGLFFALFIFSLLFAKMIKKQMLNLEPYEIALLVKSQKSIMESIFEGVIAIDLNYNIININRSARTMLDIPHHHDKWFNYNLSSFIQSTDFIYSQNNKKEDKHDHICYFNDELVIANRIRIIIDDQLRGWVITFRYFNEINQMSKQLTQISQYVDNLRTLRHEHLNWMATLSGLIYMQRYDEAQSFITLHSVDNQKCLDFITQHIKVPAVCGLLIGKFSRSHEINVKLVFDPACQLSALPPTITEIEFMSILGNLIDNAFNASLKNPLGSKTVTVYLSDATDEIVLEVSDQGCGVEEKLRDSIFEPGVSTQDTKEHGIGLHLVSTYTKKANGYITLEDNQPYGAIFSIFIPK